MYIYVYLSLSVQFSFCCFNIQYHFTMFAYQSCSLWFFGMGLAAYSRCFPRQDPNTLHSWWLLSAFYIWWMTYFAILSWLIWSTAEFQQQWHVRQLTSSIQSCPAKSSGYIPDDPQPSTCKRKPQQLRMSISGKGWRTNLESVKPTKRSPTLLAIILVYWCVQSMCSIAWFYSGCQKTRLWRASNKPSLVLLSLRLVQSSFQLGAPTEVARLPVEMPSLPAYKIKQNDISSHGNFRGIKASKIRCNRDSLAITCVSMHLPTRIKLQKAKKYRWEYMQSAMERTNQDAIANNNGAQSPCLKAWHDKKRSKFTPLPRRYALWVSSNVFFCVLGVSNFFKCSSRFYCQCSDPGIKRMSLARCYLDCTIPLHVMPQKKSLAWQSYQLQCKLHSGSCRPNIGYPPGFPACQMWHGQRHRTPSWPVKLSHLTTHKAYSKVYKVPLVTQKHARKVKPTSSKRNMINNLWNRNIVASPKKDKSNDQKIKTCDWTLIVGVC